MRTLKYLLSYSLALFVLFSCTDDENDLDYLTTVAAPSEVTANFLPILDEVTGDKGLIKITPNANGAVSYNIDFGDGTEERVKLNQGESVEHKYAEKPENEFYLVVIEAVGINGLKTEVIKELPVVFEPPVLNCDIEDDTNEDIVIIYSKSISKKVDVTVTAKYGLTYSVYFGELGNDVPETANNGEPVDYTYLEAGTYTIRVVAMSASSETTECVFDIEVTAILQPIASAKTPPFRQDSDVIGIFSEKYAYNPANDFFPYWDQGANWNVGEFLIDNDKILRYTGLTYQGIQLGANIDASGMEFLHLDIWTADDNDAKISPISATTGEKAYDLALTANEWTSFDIPLSYFIDLGLSMSDVAQFKFDGVPAGGTIFVDNIYFWKEPSGYVPLLFDDFDGNSNITTWVGDGGTGLNTAYANPYVNANNFSKTVLEYIDSGQQYANVQFAVDSKFDLSGGKSVFTLKIYVPSSSITGSQPNQISLKLQNSDLGGNSWQTQTEIIKPIVLDEWQTIIFDFGSDPFINLDGGSPDPVNRTDLDKVVIQVNSENNYDSVIAYIDDFKYGTLPPSDTPPFARDGFEGYGTITTWVGDGGTGLNTAYANPYIDTNNGSATVLEYNDTGQQYANVQFTVTPKFDLMAKSKFTLKIYVPSSSITGSQPNQISLKLQNSGLGGNSWQTQTEIIKPIVLDQWQELTFDFVNDSFINLDGGSADPIDRTDLDKVVLQVNSENNNDLVIAYIDDFNYHK